MQYCMLTEIRMYTYLKNIDGDICKIALHHEKVKRLQSHGYIRDLTIVVGLKNHIKSHAKSVNYLNNGKVRYL